MHVALVAPLMESVPPAAYGGTERVVATLADALSWSGVRVTLFATADSRASGRLVACRDTGMLGDERQYSEVADHLTMLAEVRRRAEEFDLIHFHTDYLHLPMFQDMAAKTVTTCHWRMDLCGLDRFFRAFPNAPLISISRAQRRPLPWLNWRANIYHGYPVDQYRRLPEIEGEGDYLAFLGRFSPDKGVAEAIEIAKRTGQKLKMAARLNPWDREYYESRIAPQIDGDQICHVGEIGDDEKSEFLGRAKALIFPIQWPEPFGLVMIEAMACGLPVIAFDQGAVSEVVEDGVTGVVCRDVEGAVAAIGRLGEFDRETIRGCFEARFTDKRMAEQHVALYDRRIRAARVPRKPYFVGAAKPVDPIPILTEKAAIRSDPLSPTALE